MTSPVLEATELRKTYRDGFFRRRRVEALQGVSLSVRPGEIFGLLGPNGAGKTTLIKVLLGIVRGSGGEARLFSRAAGDRGARRRVGYLPEGHRLPRHLTANTALQYYGGLSGLSAREISRRGPEMLELVGLRQWSKTGVAKFSKGMLQRLGLAQAMLHDPDLLILDEPTDGVDPVGRAEIRRVMTHLKDRGKTVFLNSHLLQELELVCDRAAILISGRVATQGTLDEIRQRAEAGRVEVALQLAGEPADVTAALSSFEVVSSDTLADGRVQAMLAVADQRGVDGVVDALRSRNVSLLQLRRRESSLEEAFLEIVKHNHAGEAAP